MSHPDAVTLDGVGHLFIADSNNDRVLRVELPSGRVSTVAASPTLKRPTGLAVDRSGTLFIADADRNRVWKVTSAGRLTAVAGTGQSGYSGDGGLATRAVLNEPWGVAVDHHDNLFIADEGNNVVRKVAPDGRISTVAGSGQYGYSGDGGPAIRATLAFPMYVAVDNRDNLFIADDGNNVVREVAPSGLITTFAGTGLAGDSGDNGPATAVNIEPPRNLAVDDQGNLYIADAVNNVVHRVTPSGVITIVAGTSDFGYSGDGGLATLATLENPWGVAVDQQGTLFIADSTNNVIRRVDHATGVITTIAGDNVPTSAGLGADGRPAPHAYLGGPATVAIDASGIIFIADTGNNMVRKVTPAGRISTVAGAGQYGYSGDGGPAVKATFKNPVGLALDRQGDLYIADRYNHVVRKVFPSGRIITVAGTGTYGYSGDGGPATRATLAYPDGLAVDGHDNLYIADSDNNVVRKITSTGRISTVAGSKLSGYRGDGGPATVARLNGPGALAVDGAGNLFIADSANYVVRKVTPAGRISTVVGSGQYGYSGDGGPALQARFRALGGVAVDCRGNLYISDTLNNVVREVSPAGRVVTIVGTGRPGYQHDDGPAVRAQLDLPGGVAVDRQGNLYIADYQNNAVREVARNGLIFTVVCRC